MKRADLPVWSATGVIPFGKVVGEVKREDAGVGGVIKEEKGKDKEVDIWEVPETPRSKFA
jgi:histone deacetylase HOS3